MVFCLGGEPFTCAFFLGSSSSPSSVFRKNRVSLVERMGSVREIDLVESTLIVATSCRAYLCIAEVEQLLHLRTSTYVLPLSSVKSVKPNPRLTIMSFLIT